MTRPSRTLKSIAAVFCEVAFGLYGSPAAGVPVVDVVNGPERLGGIALCEFERDSMTLLVSDQGKEVAHDYFCSSYGRASARLVTDARGDGFVLLTSGGATVRTPEPSI